MTSAFWSGRYVKPQRELKKIWGTFNLASVTLSQDPKEDTGGCNLANGYVIGYLPSFLFSYLTESASMIEWGRQADGHHTSTQMGSGRFPEEGFSKASYFRNWSRWKRVVLLVFIYMFGQMVLVKGNIKKELIDIVCR